MGKSLHFCKELRPGCYLHATVNLDVNEFGALESVVFIPDGVTLTEPTGSEFPEVWEWRPNIRVCNLHTAKKDTVYLWMGLPEKVL